MKTQTIAIMKLTDPVSFALREARSRSSNDSKSNDVHKKSDENI